MYAYTRFTIPFVLTLNIYFWNYYEPPHSYVRVTLFNNLYSTFTRIPAQPSKFPFFVGMKKEQGERRAERILVHSAPQPAHPCKIAPLPTSHLSPAKLISKSAPCHFAFPLISGRMLPLCCTKYFIHALTLFFPLIFPQTASIHLTPLRRRQRQIPQPTAVGAIFPYPAKKRKESPPQYQYLSY